MQQNPTSPILRSLWFTILSIVALYFASTLLLHLMLSPLGAVSDPTFWNFVIYVASFGITIGYALFLSRHQGLDFPSFHPSKWLASPRLIAAGVILMFATGILLTPLLELMPAEYIEQLDSYMQGGFWPMFTAVIAAPVLEEFLFRGIIQKNLVNRLGPVPGILLGALIFGAVHLIPQQILYASCLGVILGTIYYLTGSLNGSIAVHFVNNGLTSLLYMVFGTSSSLEHKLLGHGTLWHWAYAIAAVVMVLSTLRALHLIRRRQSKSATKNTESIEN
ncbi:CPBP family intramembrane glutamic endopeptidase [Millionella massiliensis]|uniref:CPBP family intramembrane glutamic endopeptidase n=1 Tax=Millionella massiliensis TaxID=1871023 RepID=UPI0024B6E073|nr:type II CAAX endopeptidase family protein [Millionella massiliensis]